MAVWVLAVAVGAAGAAAEAPRQAVLGRPLSITFFGPATSEGADPNPFLDDRLDVTFRCGDHAVVVPGYYAADGRAAETGADAGGCWRVHFVPDRSGRWTWRASFRQGDNVSVADDPLAGRPGPLDGLSGALLVSPSGDPPAASDRGKLRYVGRRYLRWSGSGAYFLKGGADSPENLLAYFEFDGTWSLKRPGRKRSGEADTSPLHRFAPHARDWRPGDPVWRGGKGKNLIGALNYLASKGVNSVYFLTMNVGGDGQDVWPWVAPDVPDRFDCSKLDQWNIVFDHMDRLGLMLHVVTQETENDQLLDGGELGWRRKLYYRELVARMAHHAAVVWNLGEENTNTDQQRKEFAAYFKQLDPYDNPVVVHTFPGKKEEVYAPLLGYPKFDGLSMQFSGDWDRIHAVTAEWVRRSEQAGRPWYVCVDEPGTARRGVDPDERKDNNQGLARRTALWGNLMAGGSGVEWYFGYENPHNDLNCEDWRSRDRLWDVTRIAIAFFQRYLPFERMVAADELTPRKDDYCFALPGQVYAVYLPAGGQARLSLPEGDYRVQWYNPRTGGELLDGGTTVVRGPGERLLGAPPADPENDWAILVRKQ